MTAYKPLPKIARSAEQLAALERVRKRVRQVLRRKRALEAQRKSPAAQAALAELYRQETWLI